MVAGGEGTLDADDGGTLDADDFRALDADDVCTLDPESECELDDGRGALDAVVNTAPGSAKTSPLVTVSVALGGKSTNFAGSKYVKPTSVMSMTWKDS